MRSAVLLLCALAQLTSHAAPILATVERTERDAQRLQDARSRRVVSDDARGTAAAARARRQQALDDAQAQLDALTLDNQQLDERTRLLGDDLAQVDALARSALQAQRQRLLVGPLALDQMPLRAQNTRVGQRPAGLDMLYASWFALHEEWLAGGTVTHANAMITRADGDRRSGDVQRFGAVGLLHHGHMLQVDTAFGLIQPPPRADARVNGEFLRQQVYDSGIIGVVLMFCGVLGALVCGRQVVRSRGAVRTLHANRRRRQTLALIASAALLLGLLGTVVGLIHTFRALAHFGGADASIAAAGISHALSTTWMGLTIAIPLMLLQTAVNGLPVPTDAHAVRTPQPAKSYTRRPTRIALGLTAALLLSFGLFFFMQWLTQRPLVDVVATDPPPPVSRIDWTPPPPPRSPPTTHAAQRAPALAGPALELPQLTPLPPAKASAALPVLALGDALGLPGRGGPAVGAGELWAGATSGAQIIDGSDLVPISSARPRYPKAAFDAGLEGWVEAIFVIDADGSVRDVRIIDADPAGVFEQAAADALMRWLYAPFYRDGQPVAREATQLLRFSLDDARSTYVRKPND